MCVLYICRQTAHHLLRNRYFFDGFSSEGQAEIVSIDFIFGNPRSGHLVPQYTLLSLYTSRHPSVSHVQALLTQCPPRCLLSPILWLFFMIFPPSVFLHLFFFNPCLYYAPSIHPVVLLSCKRAIFTHHFFYFLDHATLSSFFFFFFFIPLVFLSTRKPLLLLLILLSPSPSSFVFLPLICPVPRSHFPATP